MKNLTLVMIAISAIILLGINGFVFASTPEKISVSKDVDQVSQVKTVKPLQLKDNAKITVYGEAMADSFSDVELNFVVETKTSKSFFEGSENHNKKVEAVKTALLNKGIDLKDIKTGGYQIWKDDYYSNSLVISQYIIVTIDNTKDVLDIADAGIKSGASNVLNINSVLDRKTKEELEKKLLSNAIENAKEKVESLFPMAKNIRLSEVNQLENVDFNYAIYPLSSYSGSSSSSEFRVKVAATFEIEK